MRQQERGRCQKETRSLALRTENSCECVAASVLAFQLHAETRSHPQFPLIAYLYQVLISLFYIFTSTKTLELRAGRKMQIARSSSLQVMSVGKAPGPEWLSSDGCQAFNCAQKHHLEAPPGSAKLQFFHCPKYLVKAQAILCRESLK